MFRSVHVSDAHAAGSRLARRSRFRPSIVLFLLLGLLVTPQPADAERTTAELRRVDPRESAGKRLDREFRDGRHLLLEPAVFDPVRERPDFLSVGLNDRTSGEYAILQFRPGQPSARERLETRGVKFFGYLPDNAFQVRIPAALRSSIESDPAVRWIGDYLPGFKVSPRLWKGSTDTTTDLDVLLFPDASIDQLIARLAGRFSGIYFKDRDDDAYRPQIGIAVPGPLRDEVVESIAAIDEVSWIEPRDPLHFHNINSSGPIQGNLPGDAGRTIFAHDLIGTGQIVAVADSGVDVDMCFFRNLNGNEAITEATASPGTNPGPLFPDRKIIGYWVQQDAAAYDDNESCSGETTSFHGTHTSGSAVGDNLANPSSPTDPGIDPGDGMAPNAQLLFQDIGDSSGCLNAPSTLFEQALRGGARIHSNSYGASGDASYAAREASVDRFLFDHEEMSVFFSAGNSGPAESTIGSPGSAKNVVTVGAVGNGTSTRVAVFSSRGPTADHRIKPDIVAPGESIVSAGGDITLGDNNCGTATLSGTSMSTPTVAGGATLLRQYFDDGFYPGGTPNAADRLHAGAPLVKAVLLNGTLPLPSAGAFGNANFGWGRIFLDNNLYFSGDKRGLRIWNIPNAAGIKTGETRQFTVAVAEGEEFRATLVWADAEGTPGSAIALVNNLDLIVSDGTNSYSGNVFNETGGSISGGEADDRNNVEQVRLPTPAAGTYTITVRGTSVPGSGRGGTNRQGFALVTSQARCETSVADAPLPAAATANPSMGIDLQVEKPAQAEIVQVYRANGTCATSAGADFQFIGTTASTSYSDSSAQGGLTYAYRFRGADKCGEGPVSGCVSAIATGGCDIAPTFGGLESATADGASCRINLTWSAATSNCSTGRSIRYLVYRSTSSDFVPSGPPLAVVEGTSFADVTALSGRTYFYIVRAEELFDGGATNIDSNVQRLFATATGAPGAITGTFHDDGGDTAALLAADSPWSITSGDAQEGQRSYRNAAAGAGRYANLTCASITTPALLLDNGAELHYWARYNLEFQWDGVVVEVSADNGNTWSDLPPDGGYPDTLAQTRTPPINQCGYPSTHGAFTGPSNNSALTPWTEYKSSLAALAGKSVRVRWRFTSDPGAEFDGFFLDNISITNVKLPTACTPVATTASFTMTPRAPLAGQPVTFLDHSANATSWLWEFGDSATSTLQSPSHAYAVSGRYLVRLTVSGAFGSDTRTLEIFVSDASTAWVPRLIVPGQAQAQGSGGSMFRSALWMTNTTSQPTAVRLRFVVPPGASNGGAETLATIPLGTKQMVAYRDVLAEALGASTNTTGVLVVEVPSGMSTPIVTSRTYNEPGNAGTFGQYIPATALAGATSSPVTIEGLGGDAAFRTNLGVVNLSETTITATISLFDENGAPAGNDVVVTVGPHSAIQSGSINTLAGAGTLPLFSARVTATGPFFAYASKLDNVTSDPIFIPSAIDSHAEQWIDGVAAVIGGGGTVFRSNLVLANRGTAPATIFVTLTARGESSPSSSSEVDLAPGETRYFPDVIPQLFDRDGLVGTMNISSSTPIAAWARTFSDRGASGTLGQFIPAFAASELIGLKGAIFQGLSENAAVRTNVGLINVSTSAVTTTVSVFKNDGSLAGSQPFQIAGTSALSLNGLIRTITGGELTEGYVSVTPSSPGAIYAWASYVDNVSTDQTFVRPIAIP